MISKFKKVSAILLIFYIVSVISADPFQSDYIPNYLKKSVKTIRDNDKKNFRLTDDTKPSHYNVELFLNDVEGDRFDGSVEIIFEATKPNVKFVVLNADGIKIVKDENEVEDVLVYLATDEEKNSILLNVKYVEEYEKIEFHLKEALDINEKYIIEIMYSGKLHDEKEMRGLYKSYYWNGEKENREKKTLYTTHFGQQARRLMPCWDEPEFKATFDFAIHRNNETHSSESISNAKIKSTNEIDLDHVVDTFETTSKISTYILALVVSDFAVDVSGTFEVHARPEAIKQAKYALEIGPGLIKSFEKQLAYPYYNTTSVKKMSMAAIPDFSAGGKI